MRVRNIYECDFGVFLAKRDLSFIKRTLYLFIYSSNSTQTPLPARVSVMNY